MKKSILFVIVLLSMGGQLISQSSNNCWSIDYETWNTTDQPALFIDCGNDNAFNLGGELTLEAWVRAYTFAENRKFMGKVLYNEPIDNGYVLGFENLHVYAEYFNPTHQEVPRPGDGPMPADSSFVHIVTTYSVSSGIIKNYVNGMLSGETSMFPSTPIVENDRPFIIGNAPWDFLSYQFYGDMDEVRVWNIALDQQQIQNNMHNQLLGTEEGLVAYYNFNEADEEIVPDVSTNGFDGILSNWDHASTSWAPSAAPVGNELMTTMLDVTAVWYRNVENYHHLVTDNGLIIIANIPEKDFRKYIVAGYNGLEGTTNTFEPDTKPVNFVRSNREWYINTGGEPIGTFAIRHQDAGIDDAIPLAGAIPNYALLHRATDQDNYRAVSSLTMPVAGFFQALDYELEEGYYALGYSTEIFPIEGPDAISESVFTNLSMSPNPVSNQLTIEGVPNNTSVSIYNISGSLIGRFEINSANNQIDFSQFNAGVYIIQMQNNNQVITKKIVKNN